MISSRFHKIPIYSIKLLDIVIALTQNKSIEKNKCLSDFLYFYNQKILTTINYEARLLAQRLSSYIQKYSSNLDNIPLIRRDPFLSSRLEISLKYNKKWSVRHSTGMIEENIMLEIISQLEKYNILFSEEQLNKITNNLHYCVENFNETEFKNKVLFKQEKRILSSTLNSISRMDINQKIRINKL